MTLGRMAGLNDLRASERPMSVWSSLLTPGARASPTSARGSSRRPLARRAGRDGRRRSRARNAPGSRPQGRRAARRPRTRPPPPPREGGRRAALPPVRAVRAQGRAPSVHRSTHACPHAHRAARVPLPCLASSSPLPRSVGSSRLLRRSSSTASWGWSVPSARGTRAGSRVGRRSAASCLCSSAESWPVSYAIFAGVIPPLEGGEANQAMRNPADRGATTTWQPAGRALGKAL